MEKRKPRRRSPMPYIILNIIISALTTLLVLWLWSRGQANKFPDQISFSSPDPALQAAAIPEGTPKGTPEGTNPTPPPLPPLEVPAVKIVNVFGTNDLENEVVIVQNVLEDREIRLDGWQLKDEDGNVYTFKPVVLNPGAQIQVFSKAGYDTVTSLFWNRSNAVWQSGKIVKIIDYESNTRATFEIP